MKQKIKSLLSLLLALALLVPVMAACNGTDSPEQTTTHTHTFGEWTVTQEPTDTHHGEKTRTCSVCGEKETDVIPPTATSEGLSYTLSNFGTYYIVSGIGTCKDTEIVIPSTYNGTPVKTIGEDAFFNCSTLKSVFISSGITLICDQAFSFCTNLQSIVIPDSVSSIGISAFGTCKALTSITIPDSVTSIGHLLSVVALL